MAGLKPVLRHQLPRRRSGPRIKVSAKERRTVDGIVFDSKLEADRYIDLVAARKEGTVVQFLRQVPFHLPGGVRYLLDFLVFWSDGTVTFEDVKGHRTEQYLLKKKQVEDLYAPIRITEL